MTLREIRRTGVRAFFSRRWFGRAVFVTAVFSALQFAVTAGFSWARQRGFSSWADFLRSKAQAFAGGLDYAVPSRSVALNFTYATSFETFLSFVVTGIVTYGVAVFALRMVRDEDSCGYAAGAFGGFARPLEVAWLLFRLYVQILLWSLLFLVPGVVAYYRYRAAWYLKAENPDWSAGRCIAESSRVMNGHKGRCFALDCSYWLILTLLIVLGGLLAGVLAIGTPLVSLLAPLSVFLMICLTWCIFAGQTVFYLSIVTDKKENPTT